VALALPGPGTDAVVANLRRQDVAVEPIADLAAAVRRAVDLAEAGDTVLLSPACPGFFSLYYVGADEDTGFRKLVREATLPRRREYGSPQGATSPPARKPQT
jgi:UDP-N-acetylmuramoylalanine-D-glutamate ligase